MKPVRCALLLVLWMVPACARLAPYHTPEGIEQWQDPSPPRLSLADKAAAYQARLAALHEMPDGVIRYRAYAGLGRDDYGDLADGPFFSGLDLAAQAFRLATTGDADARSAVERALDGMELLMAVTGRPGLLARWVARAPAAPGAGWIASTTRPGYWWRADVSKDQLAGYACGLGVALALLEEPELRAHAGALAVPLAEHLRAHGMRIVDYDGERTRYGDLNAHLLGFPLGVNALIALAVAKASAVASGEPGFYASLVDDGYVVAAGWARLHPPGKMNRVNENMAYAALLPLLLLETDADLAARLRASEARLWDRVQGEHNAFFAFVHALASRDAAAAAEGSAALREFPDRKLALAVDLTRDGFAIRESWWKSGKGEPRAAEPLPLYLRPSSSNLWVDDPHAMVGSLKHSGQIEFAGIDYLLAYWLGRQQGFVGPAD